MNSFVFHKLQDEMELLDIIEREQKEQEKEKKGIDITIP